MSFSNQVHTWYIQICLCEVCLCDVALSIYLSLADFWSGPVAQFPVITVVQIDPLALYDITKRDCSLLLIR